jgi:hypothetical protein
MRSMTRSQSAMLLVALAAVLFLAACGTSTASTSSTPTTGLTGTPATTATATPANSHPTSVPLASVTECGHLLSLSEANQDAHPVSPATAIFALEVSGSALCYYETAQHQTNVALVFKAYSGGTISQNLQQATSGSVHQATITSTQPVSGIGDQALYVTLTGSSTVNGVSVPVKENILLVVAGAVSFGIINVIYNNVDPLGSASAATVLNDFEQIAPLVISRL